MISNKTTHDLTISSRNTKKRLLNSLDNNQDIQTKHRAFTNIPKWIRDRKLGRKNNLRDQQRLSTQDLMSYISHEAELKGHKRPITSLDWTTCGTRLLSCSTDGTAILWDPFAQKPLRYLENPLQTFNNTSNLYRNTCAKFINTHSGVKIAYTNSQQMKVVDPMSKKVSLLCDCKSFKTCISTKTSCSDVFWYLRNDDSIVEFDLRTKHRCINSSSDNLINISNITNQKALILSTNPASGCFAVGFDDGVVRMFDKRYISVSYLKYLPSGKEYSKKPCISLQFNGTGKELLVSYKNDSLYLFRCDDHTSDPKKFAGHLNRYSYTLKSATFFGSDDEYIVAPSDDGCVFFWNKSTAQIEKILSADRLTTNLINYVQPHPFNPMIATGGLKPVVNLWTNDRSRKPAVCVKENSFNQVIRRNENALKTDILDIMVDIVLARHNNNETYDESE